MEHHLNTILGDKHQKMNRRVDLVPKAVLEITSAVKIRNSAFISTSLPAIFFHLSSSISTLFTIAGIMFYVHAGFNRTTFIGVSAVICFPTCFTDSFIDPSDGKLYYGIDTFKGFYIFDYGTCPRCCGQEDEDEEGLKRFKINGIDIGHAFLLLIVFLVFAKSDTDVQSCLVPESGANMNVLLMNLPLGAGVLASFLFTIFPTTRRGLGYTF
ncbi:Protein of unknown function DUF679 [Cynara cardunculus var. scolymus]|uniref:Uncharacterized protein n=1 Tax=Cynara cardunculus var. scolymus TaxID=59895 RepID=A0A103YBX6_CYNCS|nr:Protein of unknown function DUF679 [Cynara cardunculus var. scolymus]